MASNRAVACRETDRPGDAQSAGSDTRNRVGHSLVANGSSAEVCAAFAPLPCECALRWLFPFPAGQSGSTTYSVVVETDALDRSPVASALAAPAPDNTGAASPHPASQGRQYPVFGFDFLPALGPAFPASTRTGRKPSAEFAGWQP